MTRSHCARPTRRARATISALGGLTAVLAAPLLSSCGGRPPSDIRIGVLALMGESFDVSSGIPTVRGAELAAAELNAAGGVLVGDERHPVRIVVRRYDNRPDAAASAARALLNLDSVHILVGPQLSAHAVPVSVIAEEVGVPMISPMSSNPETTLGKRFVFRLAFLDGVQGRALGQYAVETLGARTAGILFDESSSYSSSVAHEFASAFVDLGGRVVVSATFTADRTDSFRDQLEVIAESAPDVLLMPNNAREDSIQVIEARELGITATFLGSDSWDLQRLRHVGAAQGTLVAHQWHADAPEPEVADFRARFVDEYGRDPRTTAAMTYDAVEVLARAIEAAGSLEGDAVVEALTGLAGYRGATGLISFEGSGDPRRSVAISTLRDGDIAILDLIHPGAEGR